MLELGVFGGLLLLADDTELFETDFDLPDQGFKPLGGAAPEVGGRVGYFPLRFLGVEAEGSYGFTRLEDEQAVNVWTARGHVIARLPRWSLTPFVLIGGGVMGVDSGPFAVGDDIDPMLHFGGGLSAYVSRSWMVRFDARDLLSPSQGNDGGATHNGEFLLGVGWTWGRKRQEATSRPPTTDPNRRSPIRAVDTDGDSYPDPEDACPQEPGGAPDGCPDRDPDDDGVMAPEDACPHEVGPAPDGCPPADPDQDGLVDPADQCPERPETYNEYLDDDGCPDEVPEDLDAFAGTLEGVRFQIDRARLRSASKSKLDAAAEVLKKYTRTRVQISGHTDSTGSAERNLELSLARAEAVKAYLVAAGVEADRIATRGAGADEPIDTNQTPEGRAKNRRIEFRLLE